MDEKLIYNALALTHISKNPEMKADLNKVLQKDGLTVDKMLKMKVKDFMTNANEVMNTGATGFGKDWVEDTVIIDELLERAENSKSLLAYGRRELADADTLLFPVRGKKARMSILTENADLPDLSNGTGIQRLGTPTVEVKVKELTATVFITDKLMRQSVISMGTYVFDEIFSAWETSAHEIIINGHTKTGTGNINYDGGNTSSLYDGNDSDILLHNGARFIAIDGGHTVDAGNNLDLTVIREARAIMGLKGQDPTKLVLVVSNGAYTELMGLSQVETMEKFGNAATVKDGVLTAIDGMEVLPREELTKAMANGKISSTAANNDQDQLLIIHTPSMLWGTSYGLETELSRYAVNATTGFTGRVGLGLGWDDTQNNKEATAPVALITNASSPNS